MGLMKLRKTFPKAVSLGLVTALCLTAAGSGEIFATETGGETGASGTGENASSSATYSAEYVSERISNNYSKASAKYSLSAYTGEDVVFEMGDAVTSAGNAELVTDTMGYDASDSALDMGVDDESTLTVDVPKDGIYFVNFDYISYDESVLPVEFSMKVDGAFPFYECRSLKFESTWKPNEPAYDRYDNEVVTVPTKQVQWESKYLMDSSYRHARPLALELTAGKHELTINVNEGNFLLGNISLCAPFETPEYTGSETAEGAELIPIQGEDYAYTNDSSIHSVVEYDTSIDPYETSDTVLNALDSDSFASAGQRVTYEFEVEKAGYYYIAANYRQSDKTDFPVFVDVAIDGVIPNKAFESYKMAYTTKYRTSTMTDDEGNYLSVYLDEGVHTISYTISMENVCAVMESLEEIMSGVNDLALEITKVAGTNSDKYRDLKLTRYIPNLTETLYGYADQLYELEKSALPYSESKKNVAVMSSMIIAAEQLISLGDEPDEIPYRVKELATSSNSANQYLANTIDSLMENGIAIDRIYIYQEDAKLPKAPGFFSSAWMNVKRFVASFTEQAYSTSNTNPEHLQVWVNRSNQYIQIMQKMIDESFTPETGIEVDISVMPDQYKLVLSNSSGSAPDVATGINYTVPYELAVRGALVDMAQFDDFREAATPYEPGFFMTGTIGDSVYAMPETMNFWVLYYRTDVMEKLGLEVPQTMDDVIDMLPELQMRGLNFYYPTAGMITMRNFHGTTPLIVQNGGSLYYEDAASGTALGSEESVAGMTQLTELFTIYDMDVNVDNFYQHFRNGDLPIGIADFGTYNLLTNAAPELSSSWEISLIPGTLQEDGSINRSTCGCAESSVIFKSDEEREAKAWEFVKWWSSTDVQAQFGQTIQITYGDEYMWATANQEAFKQLPWDTDDKEVITQFAANVVDVARVPGTYMLEREISNAFNDIVVNGNTAQTRIDKAVKTIDREIDRKLEEFGFNDSNGDVIEEYRIPTYDSVKKLLGRADE